MARADLTGIIRHANDQGSAFLGSKGVMVLPHFARPKLFPEVEFKDIE